MGISEDAYERQLGKPVTPEIAGTAFVSLATGEQAGAAYLLTGDGLQPLSDPGQAQRPAPTVAASVDRR
jgi:hypothetical protein